MFYVIRHGRTDWNEQYRLQGNTDIPLNDTGRQQAREAAEKYADVKIDICYCSPLVRAQETARILLKGRDIPVITDERLREVSFGIYEGTSHIFEHPESPVYNFFKDPAHYIAPETAESFESLCGRARNFIDECVTPFVGQGKDILVVGHGALNSALIKEYHHMPLEDYWKVGIPNCGLIDVEKLHEAK